MFRGTALSLGAARFTLYAIWFAVIWRVDLSGLPFIPSSHYKPAGIMRLFGDDLHGSLSPAALDLFRIYLLALTGFLALGVRPFSPVAAIGACSLLFFDSLLKSYGSFINHGQVGILYAALAMPFFPAGDALSLFRFRKVKLSTEATYRAAMVFPAFAFSLAYVFVGIRRLALGPEVLWNDSLPGWLLTRTLSSPRYDFTWSLSVMDSGIVVMVMKAGFVIVTLAEVMSPWALFNDRFRRVWLLVMIPFHFSTLFFMNIFFWENLLFIMVWFTGLSYQVIPALFSRNRVEATQ